MDTLLQFIHDLNKRMGIALPAAWRTLPDLEISRRFLQGVNEYFFQTHDGIGETKFENDDFQYFSEFHKYWEANHKKILALSTDSSQALLAAQALSAAVTKYGPGILQVTHDTHGLGPRAIANVRFFTANQDFREPPKDQFLRYMENPSRFDPVEIAQDPAGFLSFIGSSRLSQNDKREGYACNAAKLLIELNTDAFGLAEYYGGDVIRIREALTSAQNAGYGDKKANMFIRDMVEMGVWPSLSNLDAIDVASDINTMKLALRLRILTTGMPLLSSFLDIFCHQYSEVDHASVGSWREVWEHWRKVDPATAPKCPGGMDFLLYRIGREHCKYNLVEYACADGHTFYHFGAGLRLCPKCKALRRRSLVRAVRRLFPCQATPHQLPREDGVLLLPDNTLLRAFNGTCIFEPVCLPCTEAFTPYDPPKSISIKGQTGWTNSYADTARGGGGMMG